MKIAGSQTINAQVAVAWQLLTDPETLSRAIPGCQAIMPLSAREFELHLELGIAAVKGSYRGRLGITDTDPPQHFKLTITAEGAAGFVNASISVDLVETGSATLVKYDGEAQVGGPVAAAGQRVLGGVSKLLINQFFSNLKKEVEKAH